MANIIAFAGSLRRESWNKSLVQVAAEGAREKGAKVTFIDLLDYPLPLFSQDIETEGTPTGLAALQKLFSAADGLLIASPEYNGSFSGVLKNTLDWLSRPDEKNDYQPNFDSKVAGVMATSPGRLGGIRGLAHLRDVLNSLGSLVIPKQVAVPSAYEIFKEGKITNARLEDSVKAIGHNLASMILNK